MHVARPNRSETNMPAELTVFLGPLQNLLAWFQKHKGVKNEQKDLALHAMNKALVATKRYLEEKGAEGPTDRSREFGLAELWADAATKARHASGDLAAKLNDKSQYWSEPLKWSREEVLLKRIDLESLQHEARQLLMSDR